MHVYLCVREHYSRWGLSSGELCKDRHKHSSALRALIKRLRFVLSRSSEQKEKENVPWNRIDFGE